MSQNITVLANQFYEYSLFIKGYSKQTIKRYNTAIKFYCKYANITDIEQVSQANVRGFLLYGRIERNWKPNTFIIFHKSLAVFFRWCVKEKYLAENPAEEIELPKLERTLPPKLTKQESLRLLEIVYNYPYDYRFLRYRNHALFAVMLFAGLRRGEVINLKYADVDVENQSIFIRQGKGSKDRIIPMSRTLATIFTSYLEERKRLNKTCPEFFTALSRNKGITDQLIKRLVVQMREVSGIPFSSHKLRHTFATLMLEGGCDIYSLSKMMGHSDIKTTTIYLAASAEHLRSQMTKHPLNTFI